MYCTECGQVMAEEAKFCAYCGTRRRVPAAASEAQGPVTPPAPVQAEPPNVAPPPSASSPQVVRSTAAVTPIRPQRPASPEPLPVEPPVRRQPPGSPQWQGEESESSGLFTTPGPAHAEREEESRAPVPSRAYEGERYPQSAPYRAYESEPAPQRSAAPQAAQRYNSVPFAAEPGVPDSEGRRKISPVLIGAIIVAVIALAGIVWMVRSSMSFGGKAAAPVVITIYPTSAKVAPGKGVDFVAEVSGAPSSEVTWAVEEGDSAGEVKSRGASAKGDTISLYCTYMAPQKPGTYHLVATSTADKSKSATAEITVAGK